MAVFAGALLIGAGGLAALLPVSATDALPETVSHWLGFASDLTRQLAGFLSAHIGPPQDWFLLSLTIAAIFLLLLLVKFLAGFLAKEPAA